MKKALLTLFVLLCTTLLADELSWVDQQVNAIKPPRSGMKSREINAIRNPFIFLEKNRTSAPQMLTSKTSTSKKPVKTGSKVVKNRTTKTVKKVLVLGVILNNSVMISGEWYKLGESINGYTISEINQNSVLLRKQKKQLLLSTKSTSNKLKFLNK